MAWLKLLYPAQVKMLKIFDLLIFIYFWTCWITVYWILFLKGSGYFNVKNSPPQPFSAKKTLHGRKKSFVRLPSYQKTKRHQKEAKRVFLLLFGVIRGFSSFGVLLAFRCIINGTSGLMEWKHTRFYYKQLCIRFGQCWFNLKNYHVILIRPNKRSNLKH